MTQNTEDLRVRRTRKLLREALISLIEHDGRSFDAITVGEIAERAMVSRAAFYRYYQDKYDLVEQIFEETMNTLLGELNQLREKAFGDAHSSSLRALESNYYEQLTDEEFPHPPGYTFLSILPNMSISIERYWEKKGVPGLAKKCVLTSPVC